MKEKVRHPIFLIQHAAVIILIPLMPLYMKVTAWLSGILGGIFGTCAMQRFFIYCPLCGGTRAVAALVRLDIQAAWNYNAFVTVFAFIGIALDVWAWVRYFQKKEPLIILPKWSGVVFWILFFTYFVLRNCLMIFFGIDPTGDLVYFWDAIDALRG